MAGTTELMTQSDYDQIVRDVEQKLFFWSNSPGRDMHFPDLLKTTCSESSFVVRADGKILAYVIGEIRDPGETFDVNMRTGYVRLIATRKDKQTNEDWTRKGLASRLYALFEGYARAKDCLQLEAVTAADNENSIGFHRAIGFKGTEFHSDPTTSKGQADLWRFNKSLR